MGNNNFLELLEQSDKDQLLKMMDAMLTIEYKRSILQPIISSIKEMFCLKSEEDVVNYINRLSPHDISDGLKVLCPRETMIKELNGLSTETKEELVNYYKRKNKVKIERGMIGYNNHNEMIVRSPGHIYHLNNLDFYGSNLNEDQKVLGVVIENKFNVFREFITDTGEFIYGFLIQNSKPGIIQGIPEFDPKQFNPYDSTYKIGPQYQIPL